MFETVLRFNNSRSLTLTLSGEQGTDTSAAMRPAQSPTRIVTVDDLPCTFYTPHTIW